MVSVVTGRAAHRNAKHSPLGLYIWKPKILSPLNNFSISPFHFLFSPYYKHKTGGIQEVTREPTCSWRLLELDHRSTGGMPALVRAFRTFWSFPLLSKPKPRCQKKFTNSLPKPPKPIGDSIFAGNNHCAVWAGYTTINYAFSSLRLCTSWPKENWKQRWISTKALITS